jgi:hypothetical protein
VSRIAKPHLLLYLYNMHTPRTPNRTYFCDVHQTVRLEYGEFLLHPGHLVHSGVDIHSGQRYLMIIFAHAE